MMHCASTYIIICEEYFKLKIHNTKGTGTWDMHTYVGQKKDDEMKNPRLQTGKRNLNLCNKSEKSA